MRTMRWPSICLLTLVSLTSCRGTAAEDGAASGMTDRGATAAQTGRSAPAAGVGAPAKTTVPAKAPIESAAGAQPQADAPAGEPQAPKAPRRPEAPAAQVEAYAALRAKSILELQQFRSTASVRTESLAGAQGTAKLIDLNPALHRWLILSLEWPGRAAETFHLENPDPGRMRVRLDPRYLFGVVLETSDGSEPCDLWSGVERRPLERARGTGQAYGELCRSRLYLRNPVSGRKTTLEWATDFLRDRVVGGEKITVFVRDSLLADSHLATSELLTAEEGAPVRPRIPSAPLTPAIDPEFVGRSVVPANLGLVLEVPVSGGMQVGRWHAIRGVPDVYVSTAQARLIDRKLVARHGGQLNPLDGDESSALIYMVAFDLDRHELGFALGTEHPRLGWSDRVPQAAIVSSLPGPDGVADSAPLVRTGMVSPEVSSRVVGTFTGGFKRTHGAFKYSDLSLRNRGTHYGFVESGTVFSKLLPGLATVVVYEDGRVALKTWSEADDAELWRVVHARQNGLPLVDVDPATGSPRPGRLVPNWAHGNWSGSQEKRLRTLRAGVCLQESEAGRYLIYGYFSGATPSGMALTFLAYHCNYAMLLDMNALEHTYLALYRVRGGQFLTQHLIDEMSVLDRSDAGQELPRFVGFPDNRDFFYLARRKP